MNPLSGGGAGPLKGVIVVETARFMAAPFAATILAEFGAAVIKVEPPPFRPPYFDGTRATLDIAPPGASLKTGISEHWIQNGRNKLSLALDYTKDRGREVLIELLKRADIWIESSRKGTFDKFGLSDDKVLELNPRLVIVHVSGFGHSGVEEYVSRGAYDLIIQAYSGLLYANGYPDGDPLRIGYTICDYVTSVWAALAAVSAYNNALKTGKGQAIDVAMFEVVHRILDNLSINYFLFGKVRERMGNDHPYHFPYEVYRTRDGWIALAAPFPDTWRKLAKLIGIEDPAYEDQTERFRKHAEIKEKIDSWLSDKDAKTAERLLLENGVPCCRIYSMRDIAEDAHYRARQVHIEWEDPVAGRVKGVNIVPRFLGTPCRIWRGAPYLGQDNEEVLKRLLSMSDEEIARLYSEGVLGRYRPAPEKEARYYYQTHGL